MLRGGISLEQTIPKAHNRSEITSVIMNPHAPGEFITIAHDGFIRVWNCRDLSFKREARIRTPYLICIVSYRDGFLLGVGSGSLLKLNKNLEIESSINLHDDCLTSLAVTQNQIISTGQDGKICFLNIDTLEVESTLTVETPINKCVVSQGALYLAGNPAYKVNLKTKTIQTLNRFTSFILHQNEVIGCSDDRGITFLSTNQSYSIPCQYLLSVGRDVFFMSEGAAGLMHIRKDQVTWDVFKIRELRKGYSLLGGIQYEDSIIAAGECSGIFKFRKSPFIRAEADE